MKKFLQHTKLIYLCFSCMFLVAMLILTSGCSSSVQSAASQRILYSVKDAQGFELYFKEKPKRIVSTSISTDEILIDLVDNQRIAGFSYLVDDPGISNVVEKAKKVEGRVNGQSSEAIMALQPDLILIPDFIKAEVIQSLRDMGLQVYVYKTPKSMEEVRSCIRFLAEAVDEQKQGEAMVAQMNANLQRIQAKIGDIPWEKQKRIVYLRSNGAYYSPQASFNDVCRLAKVRNALAETGYTKPVYVNQEEIVRLNPDAFILAGWNYDGKHDPQQIENELLHNPSYQTTAAIKNKMVHTLPANHLMSVSQYLVYAVEDMAEAVYNKKI